MTVGNDEAGGLVGGGGTSGKKGGGEKKRTQRPVKGNSGVRKSIEDPSVAEGFLSDGSGGFYPRGRNGGERGQACSSRPQRERNWEDGDLLNKVGKKERVPGKAILEIFSMQREERLRAPGSWAAN